MGKKTKSLILCCDFGGNIKEVICNKIHGLKKNLAGLHFSSLIDEQSKNKAFSFLDTVTSENSFFNCELNMLIGNNISPFSFSAIKHKDHILMIITNAPTILNDLFEEMTLVNNEQANLLRSISKQAADSPYTINGNLVSEAFNQISRLNNELINMQRELAVKNKELKRLNRELKERSIKDPLTGLYNRWFFYEKINEEKSRANRLNYQITLAVLDINDFKSINDQYGHNAGDKLLAAFADIMRSSLRKNFDSVFRFGGDEFVVLLLDCSTGKAREIMEKINRKLIKANSEVSLSYGMVEIPSTGEKDIERFLKISDQNMYEHKKKYKKTLH